MAADHESQTLEVNDRESEAPPYTLLELHDAIRRRPALYVGNISETALHGLIHRLLSGAMREVRAGCCDRVTMIIHEDGSCSVTDNGRGLPIHFEQMMTEEMALECEPDVGPAIAGRPALALVVVNALSEWFTIETCRRSGPARLEQTRDYARGVAPRRREAQSEPGTTISFKPDPAIFREIAFSFSGLLHVIDKLVPSSGELLVILQDKRDHRTYLHGRGTRLVL